DSLGKIAALEFQIAGDIVIGRPEVLAAIAAFLDHLLDQFSLFPGLFVLAHLGECTTATVVESAEPYLFILVAQRAAGNCLVTPLIGFDRLFRMSVLEKESCNRVPYKDGWKIR